jgi:hypothetical protein
VPALNARPVNSVVGRLLVMRFDMNRTLTKFALVSIILLNAWTPKQTISNSANQNQTNASPSAVSAQNVSASPQQSGKVSSKSKIGYVPDEQTAISIAVALWIPIYGKEQIEKEKPYKAVLKNGVRTVTGTLPEGYDGGTAVAEISQDTGCIERVIHEQ